MDTEETDTGRTLIMEENKNIVENKMSVILTVTMNRSKMSKKLMILEISKEKKKNLKVSI